MRVGVVGTGHVGLVTAVRLASLGADRPNPIVPTTSWLEFLDIDLARLREAVAAPMFVDARNAMDGSAVASAGFAYISVDRPPVRAGA